MKRIAYNLNKYPLTYVPYSDLEQRILNFDGIVEENIGQDESGLNVHGIRTGNINNPTIFIHGAIHGDEWHTAHFVLKFMELIHSNEFPDKQFRNNLVSSFNVYAIPCVTPWGYDNLSRNNYNNVNCNRDFVDFTQKETQNIRDKFLEVKPFAFLNMHMYPIEHSPPPPATIVFGEGGNKQQINSLMNRTFHLETGEDYVNWGRGSSEGFGRNWGADQQSIHTGKVISTITEVIMSRDNPGSVLPHNIQMYYGITQIYVFMMYCMDYFYTSKNV